MTATSTTTRTAARHADLGVQISWVLAAAFALSAGYTIYTTIAGLTPDGFNATSPGAWVFYAVGFGAVRLARTNRRGAWTAIAALEVLLLCIAIFAYPSSFTDHLQTPIGWFENDVYVGLLILAAYLTAQRLRGVTLGSGRGLRG